MDMDMTTATATTTRVREPANWAARAIKATLVASLVTAPLTLATPATAAVDRISGVGVLDTTSQCNDAVGSDFLDFTMVMTGDLEGCWYTNIETVKTTPSGVYLETGQEIFVGSLNGGPVGTFTTTYKFEAKFAPDGSEIRGRCQHPIVDGSGTGGFEGASGRVDFKDIVETGEYVYRGHIDLG